MKNLFSKSLSTKGRAVISASIVVLIAVFGAYFYETTKKTVALTLNGQEKVIKTHATTVEGLFSELDITIRSEDYVFPSENSKVKDNLTVVWKPAKQVQLSKENEKKSVLTTAVTVEEFLKEQKVVLNEHDQVQPKPNKKLKDDMNIIVERAFPLTLIEGGKEQKVWSTSTTVADFLTQQGITLTKLDRVEPKLKEKVMEDGIVNVIRVEKVTDVVEEPTSFAIVTQKDADLVTGTQKIVTAGKEGLVSRKYEVTLENGIEVSRVVLSEQNIINKQDQVVAVGTKPQPMMVASRGNESGIELYVTATAYTASCNGCSGITATGINLHANPNIKVIAVDPNVIPLGSKVYVDGYGYAVAADTGGAIKGKKIDVFFASKADAYRWGRKTVKIKVLN